MSNRPSIPEEIKRKILLECGHRCAVDGTPLPLELAHIIPWRKSKQHKPEDLICLCANCHERADSEGWSEKVLREYKLKPWVHRHPNPGPTLRIELTIEVEHLDENSWRSLMDRIANYLEITPGAIRISSIEKSNSVKITIELPTESAEKLLSAYSRKDPKLLEYIPSLVLVNLYREKIVREYYPIEKKWAILIGINKYFGTGFTALRYAVPDVVAIYELLTKASYDKRYTRLMTDETTNPDLRPTRNNILREISRVSREASERDAILIYFSGHGAEKSGQSFLVPTDALYEIIVDTAIPLENVKKILLRSKARFKILVMDSCHVGARFGEKGDGLITEEFLKSLEVEAEGWAIFSSSRKGEVSWEWEEKGHSVFTYHLIEALKGEADYDNDGIISIYDAGKYVSGKVKEWAEKNNQEQNPILSITTRDKVDIELVRLPEKQREVQAIEQLPLVEQIKEAHGAFKIFPLTPSKLRSYDDIKEKENIDSLLEIQLVPFGSHVDVPPFYRYHRNMLYHLRFYFPKHNTKGSKFEYLIIMFNGLAEATPGIYDDLGLEFAKNGIPSVLFPLTNHFYRRTDFRCDVNDIFTANNKQDSILTTQDTIIDLANHPERIIHGYIQMMSDVDRFWNSTWDEGVYPDFHEFYNEHFDNNTKICLLGYSLGGILTLALLLKDPERYHSIYLLESGANFSDINAGVLFVRNETITKMIWKRYVVDPVASGQKRIEDVKPYLVFKYDNKEMKEAWEKMVERVNSGECIAEMEKEDPFFFQRFVRRSEEADGIWDGVVLDINESFKQIQMTQKERDIFEKIVIGNYKSLYKEELSKLCNKILIFLGGIDTVFTMSAIQSFAPEKTNLAIVQLPGLGHWLKFSSRRQWLIWKELITKTIINFSKVSTLEYTE
ncbi:MAG: caspase family protein [candidate division Zixibacteria bacterium]|nr:caspase family protein [candidate division Zixibacteria bacterium]